MASVALVVLDTLRYGAFEAAFDWLPGRRFTSAYSTSHWTVPAHASLFTGRYPSEVGVHGRAPALDCPESVLAERLREAGVDTRCYTANPQLAQYEGWDRGFAEFVPYASLDAHDGTFDWGRYLDETDATGLRRYLRGVGRCVASDAPTFPSLRRGYELYRRSAADGGTRSVLDRVRNTGYGDREFLFVNLMETHTPYHPPEPGGDPLVAVAADAFTGDVDYERVRRAYRASTAYLADAYRDLFAELRAAFDYVVTCADHGELLGEYGLVNHSFGLYPELIRVPLVVSGPDVEDGTEDRVVSLLDVHRTVADLAGVDVDSRGQDLLGDPDPVDRRFEYHGLLPFHEAQFARKDVPAAEYRRREAPLAGVVTADGAYAYETHTEGLCTVGDFDGDPRERIDAVADTVEERPVEGADLHVSDAVRDRLEDLGYA